EIVERSVREGCAHRGWIGCCREHDRVNVGLGQYRESRVVGQVGVEQHQVGLLVGEHPARVGRGQGRPDDLEAGYAAGEGDVDVGDPEVVLHDQYTDHFSASAATA